MTLKMALKTEETMTLLTTEEGPPASSALAMSVGNRK
jgi:hypothetical protein